MKAYRFEDSSGFGPYHGCATYDIIHRLDKLSTHPQPEPVHDGIPHHIVYAREFRYGCASLESLLEWFYPVIELLAEFGYRCVVYDSVHAFKGYRQVAFNKETAEIVEVIPL